MTAEVNVTGDLRTDAGVLAVAAVLGLIGGLAQSWVAQDPAAAPASPLRSTVVGVVAAIGALWAQVPSTGLALVGQSLLAGYFGRAVLALLQTRVTAALERDRKIRAVAVAQDALKLCDGIAPPFATLKADATAIDPRVTALRARLDDIST